MTTDEKRGKAHPTRVSMDDALKGLDWVRWPPKAEGEECECGCRIENGAMKCCKGHQPHPG